MQHYKQPSASDPIRSTSGSSRPIRPLSSLTRKQRQNLLRIARRKRKELKAASLQNLTDRPPAGLTLPVDTRTGGFLEERSASALEKSGLPLHLKLEPDILDDNLNGETMPQLRIRLAEACQTIEQLKAEVAALKAAQPSPSDIYLIINFMMNLLARTSEGLILTGRAGTE